MGWDSSLTSFNGFFLNERAVMLEDGPHNRWARSWGEEVVDLTSKLNEVGVGAPTDAGDGFSGSKRKGHVVRDATDGVNGGDIDGGSDDDIASASDSGSENNAGGGSDDEDEDEFNISGGGDDEDEEEEEEEDESTTTDDDDDDDDSDNEIEGLEEEEKHSRMSAHRTPSNQNETKTEDTDVGVVPEINVSGEESISLASNEGGKGIKTKLENAREEDSGDAGPSKAKKSKPDE